MVEHPRPRDAEAPVFLGRETDQWYPCPWGAGFGFRRGVTFVDLLDLKEPMPKIQSHSADRMHLALKQFNDLPDSAGARLPVVQALFGGISAPTVWRWTRDGKLPAPTKRGGVTTWPVGGLRRALSAAETTIASRTSSATAASAAKRETAAAS